jgi:hypothetical protein
MITIFRGPTGIEDFQGTKGPDCAIGQLKVNFSELLALSGYLINK